MSELEMVREFQDKFDVPMAVKPTALSREDFDFRFMFLQEELWELHAAFQSGDLAKQADALVDLDYVLKGTVLMMGLPWKELYAEVHRANMSKERCTGVNDERSTRGHRYDVVKPVGWKAPDIDGVLSNVS